MEPMELKVPWQKWHGAWDSTENNMEPQVPLDVEPWTSCKIILCVEISM